jgi:hypothetical protein
LLRLVCKSCKEIPYAEIERRGAGMYREIAHGKQAMAEIPSAQRRGSGDRHAPSQVVRPLMET